MRYRGRCQGSSTAALNIDFALVTLQPNWSCDCSVSQPVAPAARYMQVFGMETDNVNDKAHRQEAQLALSLPSSGRCSVKMSQVSLVYAGLLCLTMHG
jgi:hypothetical protein